MTGCVFKRKLPSGKIAWGYSLDFGKDASGKRIRDFNSGYQTKGAAKDALEVAMKEHGQRAGHITQETSLLGKRVWAFSLGDMHKTGFESKDAASAALQAAVAKQSADAAAKEAIANQPPDRGITLTEFFAIWLRDHASRNCAPKTLERYGELSRYIIRELGEHPVNELTTVAIQTAVHRLSDAGGMKTEEYPHGRPLAPKTVRHIGTLLYTCLSEAERLAVMTIPHPMANKRVKLPKLIKRKPAVLDTEKLAAMFERAKDTRLYPFVVLAASTGCRRGELLALTWQNVNMETGDLIVSKSLEQTKKGGLRVKSTKSGEERTFVIPEFAIGALATHRQEQDKDRAMFGNDYQENHLVFCQPSGAYYSPDRVGARVVELLRSVGLEGVSLHSLRHSHASVLLSNGVPLAVVSERLGHADQNITLAIYSHVIPADKRASAKVWNDAMADVIQAGKKPATRGMVAYGCTKRGEKSKVVEKKGSRMAGTTGLEPAKDGSNG